jgi:hypothetical protein
MKTQQECWEALIAGETLSWKVDDCKVRLSNGKLVGYDGEDSGTYNRRTN